MKFNDPVQAFTVLQKSEKSFDPELLAIFRDKVLKYDDLVKSGKFKSVQEEEEVSISVLSIEQRLAKDIFDIDNRMVVAKNTIISEIIKMRLTNYAATNRIGKTAWIYVDITSK
ncbi:MAG: hypothetical protein JEZ00_16715 [Anaerolineaceae bacterium]|nr:hypothetical protein [Anaerolineaceae bacterium]